MQKPRARHHRSALIAVGIVAVCILGTASSLLSSARRLADEPFTPEATVFLALLVKGYPATPADTPTTEPTPTETIPPTLEPPTVVQITGIEYDPPGDDVEGEYVQIRNSYHTTAVMTGWTLSDAAGQVFTFPTFSLPDEGTLRVWTKSGVDTVTDLYWGSAVAIWDDEGDPAILREADGDLVDRYSY